MKIERPVVGEDTMNVRVRSINRVSYTQREESCVRGHRATGGKKAICSFVSDTSGVSEGWLRQQCLAAVLQWPGCETVREIGASFGDRGECCLFVTDYGVTSRVNQRVADRAVRSFQNEARRHFHLVDMNSGARTRIALRPS
jgi:hypothetical protein